ncbi:hypothetical protein G7Y89_g14371 [Cudoniella acicularis]|uniref:Transcription factor domain-containing protein n=1 Tax=Cudoniella acicularis TaxID=354080 RepID=A0A8H4R5P3_9HELO|nr:hypothetical protein G7Y89_g14371 [Cudoniella acicularis]
MRSSKGLRNGSKTPSARTQMTASSTLGLSVILREFPSYSDAKVLLDIFTRTINAMYHILHIPTTSLWLEGLFAEISANLLPSATQLAFFLGIFAGAVYASKNDLHFETAGLCGVPQMTLAESWLKQAVFLLTNPLVPASTQALQTFANLAHLCTQIEGFSGSLGILTISGARMAKSMKIHRLDTFHYREERKKDGADMIDIEVKRRIWWHIVSSDWLRSTVGGPDEGTYIFHPQQMEIFHPSNVDDDDIPTGVSHLTEDSYSLPLSSPTSITYFLYRIQAANLSREVTDNLPPSFFVSPGTHDSDEIYQKIIVLDQKYQQFLKSLPPFFQLTIRQDEESYRALIKERPYLEWQRYLINFVIHTHLARLHRPFLIRGSTQHRFAYSRMQCIRSAETVLEIRNFNIGNEGIGGFTYILAHFMMAAVILAMDVCFNQDEIRVSQRKQEVLQACRVLEEELNTKIAPPCSGAENESCSSGQLMLQSFQRAVQNLRGILRRKGSKDKPLQSSSGTIIENTAKDPLPTKEIYTMPQRQRPSALHPEPSSESGFTPANENISNQRHSNVSLHMDESSRDQNDQGQGSEPQRQQQQSPFNLPPPYDEHIHSHQIEGSYGSSGELIADELWSEFFTVGPTFNDVDWNTFLIDFENQITKV